MLNPNEFRALAETRQPGCVSIFLPTHRRRPETRQDPIRLGNLLREAQHRGKEAGIESARLDRTLAPAHALLEDKRFWEHQGEGLALLASDGELRVHRLPHEVDELVVVGERFCIRPLLRAVDPGHQFFVLALSQNAVRLLQCTTESAREVDLHDIPRSLADRLGYDWEQKSLQFHTGPVRIGRNDAMFHGHGRGNDELKPELEQFLLAVDDGLRRLLPDRNVPLVLATVDYVAAIYRQVSDHPRLLPEIVEGNPEEASAQDLHRRALAVAEPHLSRDVHQQLARFAELEHTPMGTADLEQILVALRDGRVETLMVASDATCWGAWHAGDGTLVVHAQREPGDEELLDVAVAAGIATSAKTISLPREHMPHRELAAAVLRYQP